MAKILSNGNAKICSNCKCLYSYDENDIIKGTGGARFKYYKRVSRNVKCPSCGHIEYIETVNEFYSEKAYKDWKREQDVKYFGIE